MDVDPQKFFIGLMEFFAILLPGAVITFLAIDLLGPIALGQRFGSLPEWQAVGVFLFASYLLGHLTFLALLPG